MSRARKDLTGQRFGSLTVLREGEPHIFPRGTSERAWVCKCDCGNEITVRTSQLTGGNVTSCGCKSKIGRAHLYHERLNEPGDITGKVFGQITVIGPAGFRVTKSGHKHYLWTTRCNLCGKEKIMTGSYILRGNVKCTCQRSTKTLRTCKICGTKFDGSPNSQYCPTCKQKKKDAQTKKKKSSNEYKGCGKNAKNNDVVNALNNASAIAKMESEREAHKGLVPRKCKKCGEVYWTRSNDSYLCPKCADESRKTGVYQNRICATCGVTFLGYPRSKYCPECQKAAKAEAAKRCNERKKAGKVREIGSTDICQNCGKPYIVTSGLQRYCPDCSKYVVADNIREHKREYMEQNRERFNEHHREMRKERRVCVICGKTFDSPTCTSVCSADCAAEQLRRNNVRGQVNAGRAKPIRLLGPRGPVNPQSGIPGIHLHPKTGKWELVLDGKYCGLYDTVAEASAAREEILKQKQEDDNVQGNQ